MAARRCQGLARVEIERRRRASLERSAAGARPVSRARARSRAVGDPAGARREGSCASTIEAVDAFTRRIHDAVLDAARPAGTRRTRIALKSQSATRLSILTPVGLRISWRRASSPVYSEKSPSMPSPSRMRSLYTAVNRRRLGYSGTSISTRGVSGSASVVESWLQIGWSFIVSNIAAQVGSRGSCSGLSYVGRLGGR